MRCPPGWRGAIPRSPRSAAAGSRSPGGRQEADYTHAAFRFHAERVIRAILNRYAGHPAVIGIQLDNEPGLELFCNHGVFQRFTDELRGEYGDPERLNDAWGLTYWSHRLSTWADLWKPDGNSVPQYDLAWRRFQARLTTEFIGWQAAIAREYTTVDQFVTTCIAYSRPAVEDDKLTAGLDVTAANLYYGMQEGLARGEEPEQAHGSQGWASTGVNALYFGADRAYSSRQAPFLVTETDATSIGGSWMNHPPYRGQLRQAAWALVSRGARMVEYWHWHTLTSGFETYWGGVLPHSLQPGRIYEEISGLGQEMAAVGGVVCDLVPDADVAMVYSTPSKWAMQFLPPLATRAGTPDRGSYERIFRSFYDGALDAGQQVRILHPSQMAGHDARELAERFAVMAAPGLYAADDETLDRLSSYARAGGHLIVGVRTGYADPQARARPEIAPGRLREPAGVVYGEYSNLGREVTVRSAAGSGLELPPGARATGWADGLELVGAETLVSYEHPHFGQWPAVTTHAFGQGRVTCVGTVPNRPLAATLARWSIKGVADSLWPGRPGSVTVTSARKPDGGRLVFVHNWSWERAALPAPSPMTEILTGTRLDQGEALTLAPWDVAVLAPLGRVQNSGCSLAAGRPDDHLPGGFGPGCRLHVGQFLLESLPEDFPLAFTGRLRVMKT